MTVFSEEHHRGWPVYLGPVQLASGRCMRLRPVRLRDAGVWSRTRVRDRDRLEPWEPTGRGTWEARNHPASWPSLWLSLRAEARRGTMIPLVIEVDGRFGGQLTVGNIVRGALRSAWIGYWVAAEVGGLGVATSALGLTLDHCFGPVGLHRVEATVRPENVVSQSVLRNVGFREEGVLRHYLDVAGAWRDHLLLAMTVEDVVEPVVERLIRAGRITSYPQYRQ